ncbi:30S ribosomal protein S9 [Candidatus Azambacteria bacterium]|nr:30S ribosomal protein S9 [Candidatus Azambacteria bacterium]
MPRAKAKTPKKKKVEEKKEPLAPARYIEAVGRRKTAVARVRLYPGSAGVSVNERTIETYFPWLTLQETALAPLKRAAQDAKYKITAKISGGGIRAQAEALRLGISRALVKERAELRPVLKKLDFLK